MRKRAQARGLIYSVETLQHPATSLVQSLGQGIPTCPMKLFHFTLKVASTCSTSRCYTIPTIADVICVIRNCVIGPSQGNVRRV
jgi:hypothetical protein